MQNKKVLFQSNLFGVDRKHNLLKWLCFSVFLLLLLVAAGQAFAAWEIEKTTSWRYSGQYPDLALDGQRNPHVVYSYDLRSSPLGWSGEYSYWYAHKTATGWETERIANQNLNHASAIAVDGYNRPHIVLSVGNEGLQYQKKINGNWVTQLPLLGTPLALATVKQVDIVIDTSGYPHIAFLLDDGSLRYTTNNGSGWETTFSVPIDQDAWLGFDTNVIALDASSRPHIMYKGASGHIEHAYRDANGSWWTENIIAPGDYSDLGVGDFVIDKNNAYHLGFVDEAGKMTWLYAPQGFGQPETYQYKSLNEPLITSGWLWNFSVGKQGRPNFLVQNYADSNSSHYNNLTHFYWTGQWVADRVVVDLQHFNSWWNFRIDNGGQPHAVYYGQPAGGTVTGDPPWIHPDAGLRYLSRASKGNSSILNVIPTIASIAYARLWPTIAENSWRYSLWEFKYNDDHPEWEFYNGSCLGMWSPWKAVDEDWETRSCIHNGGRFEYRPTITELYEKPLNATSAKWRYKFEIQAGLECVTHDIYAKCWTGSSWYIMHHESSDGLQVVTVDIPAQCINSAVKIQVEQQLSYCSGGPFADYMLYYEGQVYWRK